MCVLGEKVLAVHYPPHAHHYLPHVHHYPPHVYVSDVHRAHMWMARLYEAVEDNIKAIFHYEVYVCGAECGWVGSFCGWVGWFLLCVGG